MTAFEFPVGYHRFHRRELFNFQLNRWYSLGYGRFEDMARAGKAIRSFSSWKHEMLKLAQEALAEGRLVHAAFYTRAAELYTFAKEPDKLVLYDRFVELFNLAFADTLLQRHLVPYGNAFLPVIRLVPESQPKGVLVLHGGFDSFIEEWTSMMCFLAASGYEVIGFEGPGQGAALRKFRLPFILEWEKPVGNVLDFFGIQASTLVGLSMGGWLALRAAAFEPRVTGVIASGHAMDYMMCMPSAFRWLHLWCLAHCRGFMDKMAALKFEGREGMAPWVVDHLKFITKREGALDALETYVQMNAHNLHPERISQDVMIMTGQEDHLIPIKMHGMQIDALTRARSVTGRVFTREEHAQNHCQVGNVGLALDVMVQWLNSRTG